ncbi:MAG: hypothetical protein CMJ31_13560 [Phycisphaerae bacterium]|nr:hypothetical protein [Phycisphaerae bacterium]
MSGRSRSGGRGQRSVLVLFDVDLTLIDTQGAGRGAMVAAGRAIFGDDFHSEGVPFAGRIDPLILRDLLVANGIAPTPNHAASMRSAYVERLGAMLDGRVRTLPGAVALLDALDAVEEVTVGVLTGNFEETGGMKLRAAGIDPERFAVQAWGDGSPFDPPAREHLPPVAIERYVALHGRSPRSVTIVGDTSHDVACAMANGCRSLGVTTGRTSLDELSRAGADRVVEDLSSTEEVMSWLMER